MHDVDAGNAIGAPPARRQQRPLRRLGSVPEPAAARGEPAPAREEEREEGGVPEGAILPFDTPHVTPGFLARKRALDVVGAAVLALLTLPLWLAAAIAIRLDSRGPVLFRQERVGSRPLVGDDQVRWQRTKVTVYKFRTMAQDADHELHREAVRAYAAGAVGAGDDPDAPYKLSGDPRVTRVGHLLRKTSLDELPQLINVLQGTMSLVGPRPLPPYEVAEYRDWHYERLCALPGITGIWQIEGRGRCSFDEGTRMDIRYVRRSSLALDLWILLRTVPAVLSRRGAA